MITASIRRNAPPLWLVVALFFTGCFFYFYPQLPHVADEVGYLNRAVDLVQPLAYTDALSGERINLTTQDFPLGTAFLTAIFVWLGGAKAAFMQGWFCLLLSYLLITAMLRRLQLPEWTALLCFFFAPALVFSRSIMSDLPSLLLASIFFFVYYYNKKNAINTFFLSFIFGLSIWFRETNVIIFFIFIIKILYDSIKSKNFITMFVLVFGIAVALLPRLLTAYYIYGDAWHIKVSGYDFSLRFAAQTFLLYSLTLNVFFPFGFWQVLQYKNKTADVTDWILKTTLSLFFLFFILYEYNGIGSSGWAKASLLSTRFFVPLLPFFCLILANNALRFQAKITQYGIKNIFIFAVFLLIFVINKYGNYRDCDHLKIQNLINQYTNKSSKYLIINLKFDEQIKYITPLYLTSDATHLVQQQSITDSTVKKLKQQIRDTSIFALSLQRKGTPLWDTLADRNLRVTQKLLQSKKYDKWQGIETADRNVCSVIRFLLSSKHSTK